LCFFSNQTVNFQVDREIAQIFVNIAYGQRFTNDYFLANRDRIELRYHSGTGITGFVNECKPFCHQYIEIFSNGGGDIWHEFGRYAVNHEYGHAVMFAMMGYNPEGPGPEPHNVS